MIDVLVIVFCHVLSQCVEERFPLEQGVMCQTGIAAQAIAAEWLTEHPGYTVRSWRCEDGKML